MWTSGLDYVQSFEHCDTRLCITINLANIILVCKVRVQFSGVCKQIALLTSLGFGGLKCSYLTLTFCSEYKHESSEGGVLS